MLHTSPSFWLAVAGVGAAALLALAVRGRRYGDEPGGRLFVATLLTAGGATAAATLWLGAGAPQGPSLVAWVPLATLHLIAVFWGGFTAVRTGVPGVTRRRTGLVAGVVAGALLVQSAVGDGAAMADLGLPGLAVSAVVVLSRLGATFASLLGVAAFMLGLGLVLYNAHEYDHIGRRLAASLAVAISAAWLGLMYAFSLPGGGGSTAAAAAVLGTSSVVSAAGFWLSTGHYDLFERAVAAGLIGRDKVVETMEDAVVVVDDDGQVLDLNPVARRLFEVEAADAVGRDVSAVVGTPLPELRTAELLALDTLVGVREFEPRASVVTGAGGDVIGFSVVLRDVTERRTREERLQVLNRVLRHNLRNEVSVISSYAEMLDETGATIALDRAAAEITDTAHELAEIGEKARVLERMMAEPPGGGSDLAVADAVDQAVDRVRSSHPDCSYETTVPGDLAVDANASVLVPVLENVVENAAEHNDAREPRVEVRAATGVDPSTVTITVVDNGPGIPDEERVVLESGDVTPLEHGSGLGLWIAKWGTTRLGGELSFAATEPRGTIVTVRIPVDGPTEAEIGGGPSVVAGPS